MHWLPPHLRKRTLVRLLRTVEDREQKRQLPRPKAQIWGGGSFFRTPYSEPWASRLYFLFSRGLRPYILGRVSLVHCEHVKSVRGDSPRESPSRRLCPESLKISLLADDFCKYHRSLHAWGRKLMEPQVCSHLMRSAVIRLRPVSDWGWSKSSFLF